MTRLSLRQHNRKTTSGCEIPNSCPGRVEYRDFYQKETEVKSNPLLWDQDFFKKGLIKNRITFSHTQNNTKKVKI
jgi:hypothetical protein